MAEVLYVSRNTVKTHLRSVYQKARGGVSLAGHRACGRTAPALKPFATSPRSRRHRSRRVMTQVLRRSRIGVMTRIYTADGTAYSGVTSGVRQVSEAHQYHQFSA